MRRAEPRIIPLAKPAHGAVAVMQPCADEPPQVAEAPGCEPEFLDAEKSIEDLAVNLEPYLAWQVDGLVGRVVQDRSGAEEEEEEHVALGDDVQAVDGHDEPCRRGYEFPGGAEAMAGCL